MGCHRPGYRASARCASALLAAGVLLAPAVADQPSRSQAQPTQLADTAYARPLAAPTVPQARKKSSRGVTRGKSRKSRSPGKHRKRRPPARPAYGSKPGHHKPAPAKPADPKPAKNQPTPTTPVSVANSAQLPQASSPQAAIAVREALSLLGIPYRWGGTTRAGFDCSGFTQHVWAAAGVKIPRVVRQQAEAGTAVPLNQAQPGDLVVFYPSRHHVGIYIGNGLVVDAPHTGSSVRTDPIRSMPVSIVVRPNV